MLNARRGNASTKIYGEKFSREKKKEREKNLVPRRYQETGNRPGNRTDVGAIAGRLPGPGRARRAGEDVAAAAAADLSPSIARRDAVVRRARR